MGLFDLFRPKDKANVRCETPVPGRNPVPDGLALIDEGNALEAEGRIDEAMCRYDAAVGLAPDLARAHLNRGNVFLARGDAAAAVEAYTTALLKDPNYAAAHYNLGNAHLQSGRLEQACAAYGKAIAQKPDFTDAYVALGYAQEETGALEEAAGNYRRALQINPDYAEVHNNLGNVLNALGRIDESIASYRRALEINPDYVEALGSLTGVLQANGRSDELLASIRAVLAQRPRYAEAHDNLGIALQAAGQFEAALDSHREAFTLRPDFAMAYYHHARCLQSLGRPDEAIASLRRVMQIDPKLPEPCTDLGRALMCIGRPDEALPLFERTVAMRPELAPAHFNLGTAYNNLGQVSAAIACFRKALDIDPDFADAHNNLGVCLNDLGQVDAARESYLRAIECAPGLYQAHNNLGIVLQKIGRLDEAIASYRKALEINGNFVEAEVGLAIVYSTLGQFDKALTGVRRAIDIAPDYVPARSVLLFLHNYVSDVPAAQLLAEAKSFGELVARNAPGVHQAWRNIPDPGRYLRVGFVSGDLRGHPVGFFLEGVLAALASDASCRLTLIAYSNTPQNDAITQRLKASCDGWHSIVGLSDEIVSQKIRDDGIDILIDLSGHTLHGRLPLFAWKPAPLQVSWLGYFATTGVAAIDYLIADPWTLPESEERNFTEKIVRLPETRLCFTPPDEKVDVAPPPALSKGYVTFGCFNTLTKMNDGVVALWSEILAGLPDSKLSLMSPQLNDPIIRQQILDRFSAHGIGEDRLLFRAFAPRAEYFAAYNQVDIALDPFPYCGGTTTVEALWMGVPVLTLAGESFLSRQGVGLLMNAGLSEWVAADRRDYVARALAHGRDLPGLAALRSRLREQVRTSPVFDAARFARHFDAALRAMWTDWCARQASPQR